jgi:hypothetical protein
MRPSDSKLHIYKYSEKSKSKWDQVTQNYILTNVSEKGKSKWDQVTQKLHIYKCFWKK